MRFFSLTIIAMATLIGAVMPSSAQPGSPEPSAAGLWEQINESSGQPESWFKIADKGGVYEGVLVKGFPKPGEDPAEWRCDKCEGAEKGAPVIGLTLIKGMVRTGLKYENGTITDPRDGSVYHALMELSPDGKKLQVRGYLGIALFGRTQTWNRLPDSAMNAPGAAPRPGAARPSPATAKQNPAAKQAPAPKK